MRRHDWRLSVSARRANRLLWSLSEDRRRLRARFFAVVGGGGDNGDIKDILYRLAIVACRFREVGCLQYIPARHILPGDE